MLSSLETAVSAGLGLAGAAGLAVGGFAYASVWPTSQIFGRTLTAPRWPGELALTFDDGPNPAWTARLLEVLAEHDAKATFFLLGSFAQAEPALVRQVVAAGHLIGNHSWNHPNLARTGAGQVREQLRKTSDTLQQIAGKPVRFFRPPFGARRPVVLRIARQLGLTPVTWNAMTDDWAEPSTDRIVASLAAKIDHNQQRGFATNIVLHDGGHRGLGANRGPSVNAAQKLLARYSASHKFVTLDAWVSDPATA
ncbi:MAG TPA: polysaccharide deacetylase family protein [Terracidiphilus sp.]|jgi:peptidoglycan/xylan/chitin deacetylase (PgdA/CDA1 family)|nr:polysaccharide deacetylase family protein [Terracidiphilus sp.]